MLADLAGDSGESAQALRAELCWREFHADVLWHHPETARWNYNRRFNRMTFDDDRDAVAAWCAGRTGYPVVDAGMRQLLAEGWMHNRIRDLASNQLNWQWVAGCGTDAAPYFRVFNPVTQGEKLDPDGDYVRSYVPELRGITGKAVHRLKDRPTEYPAPLVEHAHERQVALRRYGEVTR